ncbi:batten's disease protein Cln3 [Cylindrobasidium torrendii FP15055 ss-10]|uniref:Protein BTN n=1 Tax=Cylindrobasidium torrendii FP15055 ss-10 TaxID=1314674 RepID=A0A0D7BC67_9AGAR|nr:batten's disease protein Cln3 [Cylindrobasidium torrendii FP15055 ss-10]
MLPRPDSRSESLVAQEEEADNGKGLLSSVLLRLGLSFFLFGLINNVLYVIILSAALDLVPPSTPKGIIAFCNIAPALVVKVGWPYILKGRIRYAKRIIGCCVLSVIGMMVVAIFDSLYMRLLGICLASFSSGLGELTFLQLSTTYAPSSVSSHSLGYFAAGTGAAGLVGAFLWWELRNLGVRVGVGLSCVLPFITPITFFLFVPKSAALANSLHTTVPYQPLGNADVDEDDESTIAAPLRVVHLTWNDKLELVKPLLLRYMLPLFCVYLFEYIINQGVAPTLLYPVPASTEHAFLSKLIKSIRDYYPLWQLVYQTTVFLSRSSISLGIPPLPPRLLPLPSIVQGFILMTLVHEARTGFFTQASEVHSIVFVFCLVSLEGICGGLAYVNTYFRLSLEQQSDPRDVERAKQEREFKIGSVGFADTLGILLASIIAVPTEVSLCNAQVARGKTLCRTL